MLRSLALLSVLSLSVAAEAQEQKRRDHIVQCFACHGDDGIAKDKDVPHLAGQQEAYLLKQMRDFKSNRRPHKEMRVMSREMSDEEMREIAAYFASLPPR